MKIRTRLMRASRMLGLIIALMALAACGLVDRTPMPTATVEDVTLAETVDATAVIVDATEPAYPEPEEAPTLAPADSGYPAATELPLESVEEFPLTPAQAEGPYYPVEKPEDMDEELIFVQGRDAQAEGQVLQLNGNVLFPDGEPVASAVVEIWQTDANGNYLHPDDPGYEQRDMNFQFYGESVTDENGAYAFTTIIPGEYGSRPRHIHVKVKFQEETLLTTQFYFAGDEAQANDPIFQQYGESLVLDPQPVNGVLTATMPIIVPEQ